MEFVVDGLKITYPSQTTPVFTRNAAALRYWYETERLARPADAIDNDSFASARTICGTRVQTGTDGADIRYAIDGVISSTDDQKQVLGEMDFAWQGNAYEIDGSLVFRPGIDIPNSEAKRLSVGRHAGRVSWGRSRGRHWRIASTRSRCVFRRVPTTTSFRTTFPRYATRPTSRGDGRKYLKDLGTKRFVASPWNAERLMAIAIRRARNTAVYTYRFAPGDDFANISILPGQMVLLSDRIRGISGTRMLVIHQSLNTDWVCHADDGRAADRHICL